MEISVNKPIVIATISAFLLSGCGLDGWKSAGNTSYPLELNESVYPTASAANDRRNGCASLIQATEVKPSAVQDDGGWLVLKIAKSNISKLLNTPNACPNTTVYTTFK